MKEIVEDFKLIWKKDRGMLGWMAFNFALNAWLFLLPLLSLNPNRPKVSVPYADSYGYDSREWWYLISFSVMAVVFGVVHNLLAARFHTKRGKDIARLFVGATVAITIIAIKFLLNIIGD